MFYSNAVRIRIELRIKIGRARARKIFRVNPFSAKILGARFSSSDASRRNYATMTESRMRSDTVATNQSERVIRATAL